MGACGRRGIKQESAGYPEDQDDMLSQESLQQIDREIAKYPPDQTQSAVMAALRIAQVEKGWLPKELIEFVARYLGMPPIAAFEVASFYNIKWHDLAPRLIASFYLSDSLIGLLVTVFCRFWLGDLVADAVRGGADWLAIARAV